jgi:photosystem II stability/assembly factor-like uncharacterized protein
MMTPWTRKLPFSVFAVFLFIVFLLPAFAQSPPELFSGLRWRLIGPFRGGRVAAVAGVPGNATTFYFGGVDGGVWKTVDGGVVWRPIFDHEPVASIGALAVAPSDPKVIYAGTGESDIRSNLASGDGVYKSGDGGETWQNAGLGDSRQISRIVIDPRNANVVYVGALGHAYGPNDERGVFKSSDGGAHWAKVLDLGSEIGVADLSIATDAPNVLFAGSWCTRRPPWSVYGPIDCPGSAIYRSEDEGKSWTRLTGSGLPDGDWSRVAVAVSPDGKRVYALVDVGAKSGLYRSDDRGDTWSLANADKRLTSRSWYFGNITVDPGNPDVLYVPNVALYRSEDGGKTISIVRGAPGGDDYHQIWVDPKNSASMVLGTDQGTTISVDYGKTWSSWYNQPTAQLYHVITDDHFPYVVYGTQQDSGSAAVFSRTDHGLITPRDWFPAGGSESGYMAPDPKNPDIVYVTQTYGGVSRYNLRTSLGQDITPWPLPNFGSEISARRYRDPWTPVLVFSPFDKTTLYLGSQYVMKTTDGGLHWKEISPDLTGAVAGTKNEGKPTVDNAMQRGYGVVYTIAPSSLDAGLIWAGSDTGLVHLTRDGGKNWKNVTPKGLGSWSKISLIEASRFHSGVAYAAVERHRLDDRAPYIYRTRDFGETWQRITNGIEAPAFVHAVREDPIREGLLYAGTEFGIYVSFDDGDHWQSLQLNLPMTSVPDMTVHGDDLIVATHGRSFWILDNITPLRQIVDAQQAGGPWLYRPAKAIRIDNDGFAGTPLPPEEPTAENPPGGAWIDYYLKSPAESVKLEIVDAKRNLTRTFSSDNRKEQKRPPLAIAERWFPKPQLLEKSPGMHRFVWDLAWGGGGSVDEDSDYGGPRAPRAVPGNYDVRLTVDGKTLTQPLVIAMDPRSPATPDTLDQQLKLGRQIYLEAWQSRRLLAQVNSTQKQLADLKTRLTAHSDLEASTTDAGAALRRILSGEEGRPGAMGLEAASTALSAALRVVESGDRTAPAQALELYQEASSALKTAAESWNSFKTSQMPRINDQLKQANLSPIAIAQSDDESDDGGLPGSH